MTMSPNERYHLAREIEERSAAATASCLASRFAHLGLADRHAERVARIVAEKQSDATTETGVDR